MSKKFPRIFLDVMIGSEAAGRIFFELYTDLTPKTAENFRGLCTGEYGNTSIKGRSFKLSYQGTKFHRIIDSFVVQGGDIQNGDGTGSVSIYGPQFNDENFTRRHACAGLLSMANSGRNTNGCQFFITLKAAPHLDGKHVVFGQVIEGMEVVRKMSRVQCDINDRPKIPVYISQCSQVGDARSILWNDPFSKQIFDDIQKKREEIENKKKVAVKVSDVQDQSEIANPSALQKDLNKLLEINKQIEELDKPATIEQIQGDQPENQTNEGQEEKIEKKIKLNNHQQQRLLDLKLKLNEAKNKTNKAVLEEEKSQIDPNYLKNKKIQKYKEKQEQNQKELEFKGLDTKQQYMNKTVVQSQYMENFKKKEVTNYGWNVFNTDSVYNAYEKRCKNELKFNQDLYEKQMLDENYKHQPSTEALQSLQESISKQEETRKKFSRRRMFNEDEDVNYINERNRIYNKKINRAFGQYASSIKTALERKTAE